MRRVTRDLKVRGVGLPGFGAFRVKGFGCRAMDTKPRSYPDVAPAELRKKGGLERRASDHDYTLSRG